MSLSEYIDKIIREEVIKQYEQEHYGDIDSKKINESVEQETKKFAKWLYYYYQYSMGDGK